MLIREKFAKDDIYEPTPEMIEAQMMKCREIYMKDVYEEIDKFKIDNLKKISQQKYDQVEVRADIF